MKTSADMKRLQELHNSRMMNFPEEQLVRERLSTQLTLVESNKAIPSEAHYVIINFGRVTVHDDLLSNRTTTEMWVTTSEKIWREAMITKTQSGDQFRAYHVDKVAKVCIEIVVD